jgi:uracil-DNA glycosylase family 4
MGKQQSFFLDKWELLQKEQPDKFARKGGSGSKKSITRKAPKKFDCSTCGLDKKCRSPKMQSFGEGKKGILFVATAPGPLEDKRKIPYVGAPSRFLDETCKLLDIDLDKDCVGAYTVSCFPGKGTKGKDKEPSKDQVKCCSDNLEQVILDVKPKLIVCLGTIAANRVLQLDSKIQLRPDVAHGVAYPYHKYNCWVGVLHEPKFFVNRRHSKRVPNDENIFVYDLAKIINYLDDPLPQPLTTEGNECITDVDEAVQLLHDLCDSKKPVSFDYEASRTSPYFEDSEIYSVSITNEVESASFIPIGLKYPDGTDIFTEDEIARIFLAMRDFLKSDAPKVVQNYNMEELWSREIVGQSIVNFIWDTMVTAHVINCHPRTTGLAYQTFKMTGHIYKSMVDVTDLLNAKLEDICNYNCWDSRYTLMSYYQQKPTVIEAGPNLVRFNDFFTDSLEVLADYTHRGVYIDRKILGNLEDEFKTGMDDDEKAILSTKAACEFKEATGNEIEITSPAQIGTAIYEHCKVELTKKRQTKSGRGGTSAQVFQEILDTTNMDEVRIIISSLFSYRKATKVLERIAEYKRIMDSNGFVHPTYNLNIARSYRSSSDGPNIQNVFKHDKRQIRFRKCIVPVGDNIWLEVDYDGLEVRVIAMVSGDKELARQVKAGVDSHLRWAAKIFQKPEDQISGDQRYRGKNEFIFPQFYGQSEDATARSFPNRPKELIISLCREFWEEFPGVKEWQNKTIADYKQNGYIELVTGARRPGPLNINKIYNTPIQGPAFHLLLGAANRINKEMKRGTLRTLGRMEVHDSISFDTVPDEMNDVIQLSEKILLAKRFEWQRDVPLSVSWEIGQDWFGLESL